MENIELPDKSDKALNNAVAISVVIFSVFMAFSKIKDDNIVQAMQAAKANAVDTWSEYQSTRVKQHLAENEIFLLKVQSNQNDEAVKSGLNKLMQDIAKYEKRSHDLTTQAHNFEKQYDALNFHDDQFDISDAFMAISVSVAAISALVELWWVLAAAWIAGGFGMLMGLAGFLAWNVPPDWLVRFLS